MSTPSQLARTLSLGIYCLLFLAGALVLGIVGCFNHYAFIPAGFTLVISVILFYNFWKD